MTPLGFAIIAAVIVGGSALCFVNLIESLNGGANNGR
jgi:hypothetical protein